METAKSTLLIFILYIKEHADGETKKLKKAELLQSVSWFCFAIGVVALFQYCVNKGFEEAGLSH